MKIIAATNNKGKVKELKEILKGGCEVISAKEAGIISEPDEIGVTFTQNAYIKAEAVMAELKSKPEYDHVDDLIVISDDSGLCVDILDGGPGVYSARYGGDGITDEQRVEKLLGELSNIPKEKRRAKFMCAAVALYKDGRHFSEIGEVHGYISNSPRGENGFGYDPVFFHEGYERTMAELTNNEKNSISHRGTAFRKLSRHFKKLNCLNIVLVEPEIPQNTGSIARTCAATGAKLHLVRPFKFEINDRNLKRAGLDYWQWVDVSYYDSFEELKDKHPDGNFYYATTKALNTYADVEYPDNAFLVFGKETKGLPEKLLLQNKERCIRIPMHDSIRSLNLANSVNVIVYEVYRQYGFEGFCREGRLTEYSW